MSHADGRLISAGSGEILGWFEYNGTSDLCQPKVFASREELKANWRTRDWPDCSCSPRKEVPVILETDYGAGFRAEGAWCPVCRVITRDPWDYEP